MQRRTKKILKSICFWGAIVLFFALLTWINLQRLQNNIYANYEKATDYGRVREVKERVAPIMAAIFYAEKTTNRRNITTYLEHFANYQKQNVRIVVAPTTINSQSMQVIEKLYAEIHMHNTYSRIALVYDTLGNIDVHENLLHKIMETEEVERLYLAPDNIEAEEKIEQYLQNNDYLVVMLADMALLSDDNNAFILDETIYFAQKYFYHMQVFDVIDTKLAATVDMDYTTLLSISDNKDVPELTRQQQNLRKYSQYYGKKLLNYFYKNLKIRDESKLLWPSKNKDTYRLFDRGMIYVRAFDEYDHDIFSRSKLQNSNAVVVSLIQIANKIAKKINKPIKYFKIYLLTDFEQIIKKSQDSLASYLEADDGVYIQYKRQSALITADYRPSRQEDLLAILRQMAKISDDVAEDKIRFYRFKTVEITNEN